jgi:excisionase family DNA binding protein
MSVHATPAGWGQPLPEWLSLQQAAAFYGVSVDTLRRRIAAGKLRASRFGVRLIRVRVEDLDKLFRAIPTGDELAARRTPGIGRRPW